MGQHNPNEGVTRDGMATSRDVRELEVEKGDIVDTHDNSGPSLQCPCPAQATRHTYEPGLSFEKYRDDHHGVLSKQLLFQVEAQSPVPPTKCNHHARIVLCCEMHRVSTLPHIALATPH